MKRISLVLVTLLLLSVVGCSMAEKRLSARAVEYYNYLTGANSLTGEKFDSPAKRNSLTPEAEKARRKIAEELERARIEVREKSGATPKEISADLIEVSINGRFGVSAVPYMIEPAIVRAQVRWVWDRGQWYLYTSSEAEIEKYGEFPSDLTIDNASEETK